MGHEVYPFRDGVRGELDGEALHRRAFDYFATWRRLSQTAITKNQENTGTSAAQRRRTTTAVCTNSLTIDSIDKEIYMLDECQQEMDHLSRGDDRL